jgi:hypothetical protein
VIPDLWWANNSKTRLRTLGLQKGELLKQLSMLPLGHHQPARTISRRVRQAMELPLGHLSGPARLHKLTLEEGDLLDKVFYVFMSRRQCRDVLRLPPHHILR